MDAFERSASGLPGLAALYAWDGWAPGGSILVQRVVREDLDGDGRDDLAVHFTQHQSLEPGGSWGKTVTTPVPNRLVVFLAQPDGTYRDATAELFGTPAPVVLPGYSRKVDVGDLNGDGRPDWVYALNREDGRATNDHELIRVTSAVVLSQPGNGYRVVTFGEPSWQHAARIYVSEGVGHVLAVGFELLGKPMIGDWNDAVIGMHEAFVLDGTGTQLVAAGAIPANPATFVVLPPDQPGGIASQVVTLVIDTSAGPFNPVNSHPALLERDATGQWTIADYREVIDAVPVPFVAWNGARGITGLATIDGMPVLVPNYAESALLRPTPGEDPVAVLWLLGWALPQPREDGYYYENDGQAYARFEFYRAVDGELLDADIRITGERRLTGQTIFDFEVLDVNADGLEDIVAYPFSATDRPDVYLNLGNREFMRLDDAVLPAGPLWSAPRGSGTARFLDANGDGVQDLLYFPSATLTQYYDGSNWEVHFGTTNRLADFDTRAIQIADRRAGTLIATWGGDDTLSDMNAAATDSRLDGGAGLDVATYSGAAAQYLLAPADDGEWRVMRPGNFTDTLVSIERLQFSDSHLAFDLDGNAGQVYRLYKAAFARTPDLGGLGGWIDGMDNGLTLDQVATGFIGSAEFQSLYGANPTNAQFVTLLYVNVLGRAPDAGGYNYWVGELSSGLQTRAHVLATFSETAENKAAVAPLIADGILYADAAQAAGPARGQAFNGTAGADTLIGSVGNDTFKGAGAKDSINGGAGIDMSLYGGNRSTHTVTHTGSGLTVSGGVDGTDMLLNVERLKFADIALAFDITGNAGQTYRLYQAAFDRTPDTAGLSDWIKGMDGGMTLRTVASGFIGSAEFQGLYGANPTDTQFVNLLYSNVLNRAPDQAGYDYWLGQMSGGMSRESVLIGFSESAENQAALIGVIQDGIVYIA